MRARPVATALFGAIALLGLMAAASAGAARAASASGGGDDEEIPGAAAEVEDVAASPPTGPFADEPAGVEAPRMRTVEPRTCLYVDATYARSEDLSALPNIAGTARGGRLAVGGTWKVSRFQFDAELPTFQITRLDLVDPNPAFVIEPGDKRQTSVALGDARFGAQWTAPLPLTALAAVAGFGLGVRLPTHTGRFVFHLVDESEGTYVLPYYFHVQPAVLVGLALGPVTFVMNQGALVMLGPDGEVANLPVVTPTLYFWDAHYALSLRVASFLSLSVAASTTFQLNELDPVLFPHLNRVRSVFLLPGVAVRVGATRIDLVGRFGVTAGAEPMGVITYGGTNSLTLRVTRTWN